MGTRTKIAVLGGGSFGTAIAAVLAKNGITTLLWARNPAVVEEINSRRTNSRYLGAEILPAETRAAANLASCLADAVVVVFAIPCQHIRALLKQAAPFIPKEALLVNLAKGVEIGSFKTPSAIFTDVLGQDVAKRFAVVSGPTFALEILKGMPTAAVVAGVEENTAVAVQKTLSCTRFRLYRLTDVTGVELGGAVKNVMAIAVGIAEGLGFGLNTRAGVITRCLYEMTELGLKLGAVARTFSGLSGVGDLILTCTGELSRNRAVGLRIGRGESPDAITGSMPYVAEGVPTAKAVHELCRKLGMDLPNIRQVYRILYENLSPRKAVDELLARALKAEYES